MAMDVVWDHQNCHMIMNSLMKSILFIGDQQL
jgi:hypothetical protein